MEYVYEFLSWLRASRLLDVQGRSELLDFVMSCFGYSSRKALYYSEHGRLVAEKELAQSNESCSFLKKSLELYKQTNQLRKELIEVYERRMAALDAEADTHRLRRLAAEETAMQLEGALNSLLDWTRTGFYSNGHPRHFLAGEIERCLDTLHDRCKCNDCLRRDYARDIDD